MSRETICVEGYLNQAKGLDLRDQVRELLAAARPTTLVLDFSATKLVNSIGVSFLLEIIDAAQKAGTQLEFVRVPSDIVELFGLLGICARVPVQN